MKISRFLVVRLFAVVTWFSTLITSLSTAECIGGKSTSYSGSQSYTVLGKICQRWDTDRPHKVKHFPKDGGAHNFCRNPDNDPRGPWCYTTDNYTRWDYCNIPKCPDDPLVIWINHDSSSETTHLLQAQADPEIVKQQLDSVGTFNVTVVTGSNRSLTEYWALAANYHKQLLYFSDIRSEYVGVWNLEKEKKLEKHFEGMASGIECIAYDWKTSNLYWTDSEFKWVMVAEHTFKHYTPVYKTAPDPAYGLAVHSAKRLLVFSTFKVLGSKIIISDLAGKNAKVLFSFPEVFDVTGISIDYADDRIYWTDFTGYAGMVMSSRLDGTNKIQHNYRGGAIFWGVAAYMDYLYVTDVNERYDLFGHQYHFVWIIAKHQRHAYSYKLKGKPRGIAVYSNNEEFSFDSAPSAVGGCDTNHQCDHICLPRINFTRECACSIGYHLDPDTNRCQPKLVSGDYLLVADAGQGKVFQIPITNFNDGNVPLNYSIVPLGDNWNPVTVAVDHKAVYWSDKKQSTLGRSSVDGSNYSKVVSSYANSIIVDPLTGYLFYSDNERSTIRLANEDGLHIKTIVEPYRHTAKTTSIKMITQDLAHKYIYWTDTFSKEGDGQVLRCRYDGAEKEVVLRNLHWPHAITIDYKTNSLYVAEEKTAIIYQIELSSLTAITNTSPKQKRYKQYDVSPYITRSHPYVKDLKIHNGLAYVVDGKSNQLVRFNLTQGARSMAPYAPAEFFRVTTVAVFSTDFYSTGIKMLKNPCDGPTYKNCRQLCVPLSDTTARCLCENGKRAVGAACADTSANFPDITPPTALDCPEDIALTLPSCAAAVTHRWIAPYWRDDVTGFGDLKISTPSRSSPARLPAGTHEFSYTAEDMVGNVGYCRFTVTVRDNQCTPAPNAIPGAQRTVGTCGNRVGSSFNVTCTTEGYVIWVAQNGVYAQVPSYVMYCSKNRMWVSRRMANAYCKPPSSGPLLTTTAATTTATLQSTTTLAVTAKSTISNTRPTTATTRSTSNKSTPATGTITTTKSATATKSSINPLKIFVQLGPYISDLILRLWSLASN